MGTRIEPSSRELTGFYGERSKWRDSGEEHMRFVRAARIARVPDGAAVLDIGSRDGHLRRYLPAGTRYQGIDIAPQFASEDVVVHDISAGLPFPDAAFDCAFCIEVLEHVPNPWSTLGEIHRVLRPGGVLVLSVPNPYHVKELIWNLLRIPDRQGHVYAWTVQTMSRLAAMNGFRLEGLGRTYLHPPIPAPFLLASRSVLYRFAKS
jgi:SAM-dependent methyltransferase